MNMLEVCSRVLCIIAPEGSGAIKLYSIELKVFFLVLLNKMYIDNKH
jgi:hypothetical protein